MLPAIFLEKMSVLLADEWPAFLNAYNEPFHAGLRFNPLKCKPLPLPFLAEAIDWAENAFALLPGARPGRYPLHDSGAYYLQEPSAMAPAELLAPEPGERVLDLCAAPGGKSTQLAARMNGVGLLVCNEIHPKRAKVLSSNIERMGIANALVLNEHPAKLAERFGAYFDRILVDAPCSGEGMFRKEEAAIQDWSPETVQMCAARQQEILGSAAQMLRPGGRLVYSTCTFSPEENEGVISAFLMSHPDFSVEPVKAPWFDRGRPEWISKPAAGVENCFRLWPHKLHGEGHFAAVLRRTDGAGDSSSSSATTVAMPRAIADFIRQNQLPISPEQRVLAFGDTFFLPPEELPSLDGLKVLRAGLELGELRKERFVPAHALALWLHDFPEKLSLASESQEITAYLRGETLFGAQNGWALLCADGISLGWVRGSQGVLKNHYPKGLRRI